MINPSAFQPAFAALLREAAVPNSDASRQDFTPEARIYLIEL
jgi:hypothetical protein